MPLIGAYVADKYFGRLRTIQYAIKFALFGHCILVISAMPFMIAKPDVALAVFTVGLVVMGMSELIQLRLDTHHGYRWWHRRLQIKHQSSTS